MKRATIPTPDKAGDVAGSHLQGLADFVTAAPSSFHAAREAADRLVAQGFTELAPADPLPADPGGYVAVRDGSVLAWRLPRTSNPTGFRIVGAHTDSPGFVLKPRPTSEALGWQQAGMEVYGGPLPNSWLDREFGLAGRLVTADGEVVLVATGPLLRIPQVAPHLDRSVHERLVLDRQQHLHPVFAVGHPEADLLALVAAGAGVDPADVAGHDLCAFVTEPPARFGLDGELFASPRLDNLASVHAGLVALAAADESDQICVLACFDHEEVGSASATGASGPLLDMLLTRLADALGWTGQQAAAARTRSLLVSADAGHAVHPNYAHLHDPGHRPLCNAGPLIKFNANQRYATDAVGEAAWRRACAVAGVPTQDFVSNNSVPCGSTIGPLSATRLGIRTVDIGIPLLSMHSARELCGVRDPEWLAQGLQAFYAG
ncbi:M18 family aminopeptidase [Micropruina glycogenica]|uniref:M18 family aminopeptidase n=1 Tax=Micropruina glycogenica TaxID=75385 RepID=UPI0038CBFB15